MSETKEQPDPHVAIMAGIGYICVQWAVLEAIVLYTISTILDLDEETGILSFASLDLLPRLNKAITLAQHKKVPRHLVEGLCGIRRVLQDGLQDRRNQAVHGAHAEAEVPEGVKLIMHRWREPKRRQELLPQDLHATGLAINDQMEEANRILLGIIEWKEHR